LIPGPHTPGHRCAALVTSGRDREFVMGRAVRLDRLEAVNTVLIDGTAPEESRAVLKFPTSSA
jgi:hypothetical protein